MIFFTEPVLEEMDKNENFKKQAWETVRAYHEGTIEYDEDKDVYLYKTCLGEIYIKIGESNNKTIMFKSEYQ